MGSPREGGRANRSEHGASGSAFPLDVSSGDVVGVVGAEADGVNAHLAGGVVAPAGELEAPAEETDEDGAKDAVEDGAADPLEVRSGVGVIGAAGGGDERGRGGGAGDGGVEDEDRAEGGVEADEPLGDQTDRGEAREDEGEVHGRDGPEEDEIEELGAAGPVGGDGGERMAAMKDEQQDDGGQKREGDEVEPSDEALGGQEAGHDGDAVEAGGEVFDFADPLGGAVTEVDVREEPEDEDDAEGFCPAADGLGGG